MCHTADEMQPGRIRVAFVSHLSDLSGAPRCLLQILQMLDRERFDPIAVCPGPGSLVQAISDLDICVYVVPKFPPRRWRELRFGVFRSLAKLVYRFTYTIRLCFLFRRCRVRVVFLNTLLSSGATIAARLNRLPVVTQLLECRLRFSLTAPLRRWVVLHGAHRLLALSEAVKTVALEYGADSARLSVARPGVDVFEFTPAGSVAVAELRRTWGVGQADVVFGAAGALVRLKGFHDLIAAMPGVTCAIPDCRLMIAGSLPEGEDASYPIELEEQVAGQAPGEVVRFLGQVSDMPLFFSAIDVLVIPSYEESFGLVAVEAMSVGSPVIATAVGGLLEIVDHDRTGLLVAPRRPDELERVMIRLGKDEALRERMGRAGAERVRAAFTPTAYIAAVQRVLESTTSRAERV